jgi:hypothetical protein
MHPRLLHFQSGLFPDFVPFGKIGLHNGAEFLRTLGIDLAL